MVAGPSRRDAWDMSDTTPPDTHTGGTAPPPPPPRLVRSTTDRVIAGVAGGLGRHFSIDPVIVRVALVVLTFFGGAGALLYLAAVLLVPSEDTVPGGAAPAVAPGDERSRPLVVLGVVVLVIVGSLLALAVGSVLVPLAFLALAALLVAWLATGRRPDRDPSSLLRLTLLGTAILVACAAVALGAFWAAGVGGDTFVAGLVIAAGVAVLAGAFVRPVRWLVPLALAVALPAGFVAAAGIDLHGGIGERTYRPGGAAAVQERYELGIGRLVVDLRGADLPPGDQRLEVGLGVGQAVVVVDEDVCVASGARVGMGAADVLDRRNEGVDVKVRETPRAPDRGTRLVLDADVGVGHLDVRKTDPPGHDRRTRTAGSRSDGDGRGANDACAR
jgi:phage shock protein PspC (stress-responsive transcriptional regulator)